MVPIHSASKEVDTVLYAYKNCGELKKLQKKFKNGPEWKEMEETYSDFLKVYIYIYICDVSSIDDLMVSE